MNTKEKMKTVVDLIVETDYQKAKTELKTIITEHPKMKDYKKRLSEMGLDLKTVDFPEQIYEQINKILKDYDHTAKLKILDEAYKQIATTDT
jgi:thioredoxin-like negative regulator of GroEL